METEERQGKEHELVDAAELLATEIAFFERERATLVAQGDGKYALIRGEEIGGFYDTGVEATHAGWDRYGLVSFLVRKVSATDESLYYPSVHADD